jgi:hypothetical protein
MDAFCIGNDILDIGSRRAEARVRRSAKFDADLRGAPTHFDLPNVPDVSACVPCGLQHHYHTGVVLNDSFFLHFQPALYCRSHFASASGQADQHQVRSKAILATATTRWLC